MKAYYLEKARDPSDLPNWLFDKHELRAAGSRSVANHRPNNEEEDPLRRDHRPPATERNRGFRDFCDAAEAPTARPMSGRRAVDVRDGGISGTSIANDRLKTIRDAKRNAARRNITPDAYVA